MFGGSLWAFANAILFVSPHLSWQETWNTIQYLGVMIIPTAWFLLSAKLTGFARNKINRIEKWIWGIPILFYIFCLSNDFHKLFFAESRIVVTNGFAVLENEFGPFFYAHTAYSYGLLLAGVAILGVSLAKDFKKYGSQAYGLIIGVLAPLIGNAYYLFGSVEC